MHKYVTLMTKGVLKLELNNKMYHFRKEYMYTASRHYCPQRKHKSNASADTSGTVSKFRRVKTWPHLHVRY